MHSHEHLALTNKPKLFVYFLASRPSFLTITAIGCFIGFSYNGGKNIYLINLVGLLLALLAHAASNVINDYYDYLNGSDLINRNRIYPFTGGSRFIQNNILSATQLRRLSLSIFAITILGGLWISFLTTKLLLLVGCLGIFLGWSYSATPFKLMSRGLLGEIAISLSWALVVVGSYLLHSFNSGNLLTLSLIAWAYGVIVSTILFVNQIPDINADRKVGKNTLASKIKKQHIWLYFFLILLTGYLFILVGYICGSLNLRYISTIAVLPLHIYITVKLRSEINNRNTLQKCIVLTIISAHLFGILLILSNMI